MKQNKKIDEAALTQPGRKHDPYTAPAGYFDTLTDRLMQRIEAQAVSNAQRTQKRISRLVWRYSAAACIVLAAGFALRQLYNSPQAELTEDDTLFIAETDNDAVWDAAVEYAMIDNEDISYYLTVAY